MLFQAPIIIISVLIAIKDTSIVTNPDIISTLSKCSRKRGPKFTSLDPTYSTMSTSMLYQNRRFVSILFCQTKLLSVGTSDSENSEEPTIFSLDNVRLPVIPAYFLHFLVKFAVLSLLFICLGHYCYCNKQNQEKEATQRFAT